MQAAHEMSSHMAKIVGEAKKFQLHLASSGSGGPDLAMDEFSPRPVWEREDGAGTVWVRGRAPSPGWGGVDSPGAGANGSRGDGMPARTHGVELEEMAPAACRRGEGHHCRWPREQRSSD